MMNEVVLKITEKYGRLAEDADGRRRSEYTNEIASEGPLCVTS